MFKKFMVLLLVGLFVASASYAAVSDVETAVKTSNASVIDGYGSLLGLTCYASTGNAVVAAYDATALGGCTHDTLLLEVGEATQYDQSTVMAPMPMRFTNGLFILTSNGTAIVYYK